jgi:hypothetical protein
MAVVDFDRPIAFRYCDCTGVFGGNMELYWRVFYHVSDASSNLKMTSVKFITKVRAGRPDLDYLKWLVVSKNARFIDSKSESIRETFGGTVNELINFLTPPVSAPAK